MTLEDLFSLKGRVALVTGGSRGIGRMIVEGFLAAGIERVYITARKGGELHETAEELGEKVVPIQGDISTMEGIEELVREISGRESKLDILVNNAGAAWGAEFEDFPESGWDKVMDLNVKIALLPDAETARPAQGGRERRPSRQGDQHRLDRRSQDQSVGNLQLPGLQGRADPPHAPYGGAAWSRTRSTSPRSRRAPSRPT